MRVIVDGKTVMTLNFDHMVGEIYRAPAEPDRWSDVLAGMNTHFRGGCTQLVVETADAPPFTALNGVDWVEAGHEYVTDWIDRDPRKQFVEHSQPDRVFLCQEHFSDGFVARDPLYNEFLRKYDQRYTLGAMVIKDAGCRALVAVLQPERAGGFARDEADLFGRLAHHVGNALRLQLRLQALEAERDALVSATHASGAALMLLSLDGRAQFMSRAAEDILRAGRFLRLQHGVVVERRPHGAPSYATAFAQAATCAAGGSVAAPPLVRLAADEGPGLVAGFIPLPSSAPLAGGWHQPLVLVILSDLERPPSPDVKDLLLTFGLTPSEAEVVDALAAGMSPQQIAQARAVLTDTVRTQIKAALAKTGLRRQVDLVSLVGRLNGAAEGRSAAR